jgi:hypothetical protein
MTNSDNGHEQDKLPVGAALVVGAGIAGMQAASTWPNLASRSTCSIAPCGRRDDVHAR